MKVLHYISSYSLPSETFVYDLINNLEESGLDNYVLTHKRYLEDERQFGKVEVIPENTSIIKRVYYKLLNTIQIRNKRQVVSYLEIIQPDVVHAHFGINGVKIYKLMRQHKIDAPLVVSFHGMDVNVLPNTLKGYKSILLDMSHRENTLFTVPSYFLKEKMQKLGISNQEIIVVPNSYNVMFENNYKKNIFNKGAPLGLVSVGRLASVKGHKYQLEAFAKLLVIYPDAMLTIVGEGEFEQELKELASEYRIEGKVKFCGRLNHKEIPLLLKQNDIFLQTSIRNEVGEEESFSVSTLEAMVANLYVIATRVGGVPEVLKGYPYSRIIEQKSASNIFDAIKYFIENSQDIYQNKNKPNLKQINADNKYGIRNVYRKVKK